MESPIGGLSQPGLARPSSGGTRLFGRQAGQPDALPLGFGNGKGRGLIEQISIMDDRLAGFARNQPNIGGALGIPAEDHIRNVRILTGQGQLIAKFEGNDSLGEGGEGFSLAERDRRSAARTVPWQAVIVPAGRENEGEGEHDKVSHGPWNMKICQSPGESLF